MVPHRGTNWAAPWLTAQIGQDAVLSRSYGRGCNLMFGTGHVSSATRRWPVLVMVCPHRQRRRADGRKAQEYDSAAGEAVTCLDPASLS